MTDVDRKLASGIRAAWLDNMAALLGPGGLPEVATRMRAEGGPPQWLAKTHMPDSNVREMLGYAVDLACGDDTNPLVATFRRWSIEVAEAVLADPRWATVWQRGGMATSMRGNVLLLATLAQAWDRDAALDAAQLESAGELLLSDIEGHGQWGVPEQGQFLCGVQCFLMAGNATEAARRFGKRRRFAPTRWYRDWLAQLVAMATDTRPDTDMREPFDRFFDVVRDPRSLKSCADHSGVTHVSFHGDPGGRNVPEDFAPFRLRLAALRWMYVERQPVTSQWREIVAQISR